MKEGFYMEKSIYFWGACKKCIIRNTPIGRYICTAEGYDIYDAEEFDEKYYAIKSK